MVMIPARGRWMVLVQGKYIDEINAAPDDVLSFEVAMEEVSFGRSFSFLLISQFYSLIADTLLLK
jgi:hypothetical protein